MPVQISNEWEERLIEAARGARENAYAPYSGFKVGAAVLCEDGRIFTGVNVENASYGLTCCAERTAIFKAVSEGYSSFKAIAVVAAGNGPTAPCGACRQVMFEFSPDAIILMADMSGRRKTARVNDYLPVAFGPGELKQATEH